MGVTCIGSWPPKSEIVPSPLPGSTPRAMREMALGRCRVAASVLSGDNRHMYSRTLARVSVVGLAMLSFHGVATAQSASANAGQADHTEYVAARSRSLRRLMDEHLNFIYRGDPLRASTSGVAGFETLVPDASIQTIASRLAESNARLAELDSMPRDDFNEDDKLDADLLRRSLVLAREFGRLHSEQYVVTALSGPHIDLPQIVDQIPIRTDAQLHDWATRLEKLPAYLDQCIELMRAGLAAGRVPPKVILARSVQVTELQCTPEFQKDPTGSPFYRPFLANPNHPDAARARATVLNGILPAYRRLAGFLRDEYIPACRDSIGASQSVDGIAAYQLLLRQHTTTELTPDQIHEIGLREVGRIRTEMFAAIAKTDFPRKDELKGEELFTAFLAYLRSEPRFYYTTADDLLRGYRDIGKRMDAALPSLFGRLPRNTYGVREMPHFMAPTSPTAYYNYGSIRSGTPGYFVANTYALDQRPRYAMISLTLHEAVPGHHLQLALQDELENVHELRRFGEFTAFVEGWALYAEKLGLEVSTEGEPGLGLYTDPYANFGRLSDEIWRACRLVVDTGIHSKGWTRQQAIDYMLANTSGTQQNTVSEVDRYIGWPGQACAYKVGELTISELRQQAASRLGSRFDIRAFHDELLGSGSLPLDILRARIERWIQRHEKSVTLEPASEKK